MLGTITLTVEQTEPPKVILNGEQEENMEVAPIDNVSKEKTKEDGQAETAEINAITPVSEEKAESPEQSNENQSSEVGFKKVFKFVGFKFTVKKDKTEKSEPVQLLNVKKDDAEVNGTSGQEENISAAEEGNKETQQETKEDLQQAESPDGAPQPVESPVEVPEEVQIEEESPETEKKKESEPEVEKDKKSPESPTNTVVAETSSPFRRFFTQGWAGLRKKTSFKKSKEEDPQEVEKHIKVEEQEMTEATEAVKEEGEAEKETVEEQAVVQEELSKSESEEPKSPKEEDSQISPEETKAEKAPSDQPENQKPEETVKADEGTMQVSEDKENAPEIVTSALSISSEEKAEIDTLEIKPENQITDVLSPSSVEVTIESQPEVAPKTEVPASDQSELHSSTESADPEKAQEVITTEAELLSSQEKVKAQSSPLKKLFSSSGLRKLSGKKSKGKKDDDAKADVTTEPAPGSSESPEAAEVNGGDSSASSPDESAETSPTEKPVEEEPQAADLEGEGATSDGERKKDGIMPWASFKKLVTPKRRPKRPSESDKEDEVEKAKTSTLSSTDSGGSVENQEEIKEPGEEQKLEKSTEENKKKADSSVSWDALICVGSSKKRARKTSDSDEEEIQRSQEESKKNEGETVQTKEPESESPLTSSQEQQVQESPSPDQASSPTEGDGVSTWQSFKRLVTPRRKSKTKAEEKTDETAVVSNPEQSTSEGEGSKEESWVSFKKLIPGRRKKRSDAKQEQAPLSADQVVHESAEEDSDEPAVVPLAEFDAAELEKLNAQKSVVVSGAADVLGEQKESLENPSDELIHAVTVTLIEGERAVTSLEERAPSWISARVAETIEHAKEVEEATEKIKTEITVEETVVFSTVSQVMAETQSTLMNEVELTSEALTALEEAIETSCAEETTEMLSAVSQLGESVLSTEQATPVPEDDASVQTLQEQKQLTDNILHAVAESAKLSFETINSESVNVSPDVKEDLQEKNLEQRATTLTRDIFAELVENQKTATSVVEEQIEEVIITVTKKVTECITTSLDETVQVRSVEKLSESTVEQTTTVDKDEPVSEKPSESVCVSAYDQDTQCAYISTDEKDDKPVLYATLEKSGEDLKNSAEVQVTEETLDSSETKVVVEEQFTELETAYNELSSQEIADPLKGEQTEEYDSNSVSLLAKESEVDIPTVDVQAEMSVPISSDKEAKECNTVSSKLQEDVIVASDVKHVQEPAPISTELQFKDVAPMSLETEPDVQNEEGVPVATEVTAQEVAPVVDEMKAVAFEMKADESFIVATELELKKEGDLVLLEVQTEEVAPVLTEMKVEESTTLPTELKAELSDTVSLEAQYEESAPVSIEVHTEESSPLLPESQIKEVTSVPPEMQTEDGAPVLAEVKAEESFAVPSKVQTEVGASLVAEVKVEESDTMTREMQAEECAPVPSEVQNKETAPVPSEMQVEETAYVPSEVQVKEASPVSSEVQVEETASVPSEAQVKEAAPVSSKVQVEEAAPVPSEVQVEENAPVPSEVQVEDADSVPSEVQVEDAASVPSEVQVEDAAPVSLKVQAEEAAPVPSEMQVEETASVQSEVQVEEAAPVPSEVQVEEAAPVPSEVQVEEAAPVPSEVQVEDVAPVSLEVQIKEAAAVPSEVQAEESASLPSEVQSEESASLPFKVQTEEAVSVPPEMQVEEDAPLLSEVHAEETFSLTSEVQVEEVALALSDVQAEETASVLFQIQAEEAAPVLSEVKAEETAPAPSEIQATVEVTVTAEMQAEDVQVLTEMHTEEGFPVLAEPQAECVPVTSEVQADKDTSVLNEVQASEDSKVTDEVQVDEGAPMLTEVQTAQDASVTMEVQVEECVPVLDGENVPLPTEVQTEEGGPVSAEVATEHVPVSDEFKAVESVSVTKEEPGECTALSSEVKIEGVPVLPEEPAEKDFAASTELQVKESHLKCVEGKAEEAINMSDKVDVEDITPGLVEEVVLVEEQAKEEVLVEEDVPVSAELQDTKDIPISGQAEVSNQGQIEEGVTTLVEKKVDEDVVPDELTNECVSDVQTENLEQIEEGILVSAMEKVICFVDDHFDSTGTTSEPIHVEDTKALDEETKRAVEFTIEQHEDKCESGSLSNVVNQLSLIEEVKEVREELITTDIPEFETSEASNVSETVTAAAVEEKMLEETVKPIETPSDCIQLIEKPDLNLQSEDHTQNPEEAPTLVASVSQKAAAIVDAAIEAATNCFVVDASSQDETPKGSTVTHQTEETIVESNNTKTSITTTVHITVATTVEKVIEKTNDHECVSTERQNQEDEFVSQVQEPVHEPINVLSTSAQTKGIETDDENKPSTQECVVIPSTDLVDSGPAGTTLNLEEESKPSSISIQEDIHKTSVQSDSPSTDTQEKARPVES
ncbi:A-kinase anchor protein 12 isoform X2 [Rana temporaria]|uniref:A-kinase anchor protein 12 isoform X2 n=1 Tax=Rana temporaria TaxID=8407 RepID=UPI001AAD3AB5|nr:A-kinase anchor protein 12 isoform X2 [Rana temporaria]